MAQALLQAGKAGDVVELLRQYFVAKSSWRAAPATASREQAIAPLYTLSRRFYFMHHKELDNLREVARLHAELLRAVATGDEKAAAVGLRPPHRLRRELREADHHARLLSRAADERRRSTA